MRWTDGQIDKAECVTRPPAKEPQNNDWRQLVGRRVSYRLSGVGWRRYTSDWITERTASGRQYIVFRRQSARPTAVTTYRASLIGSRQLYEHIAEFELSCVPLFAALRSCIMPVTRRVRGSLENPLNCTGGSSAISQSLPSPSLPPSSSLFLSLFPFLFSLP